MERGQERLGLKSICGYVVNDNLGKVSVSVGGVCSPRCPPPIVLAP